MKKIIIVLIITIVLGAFSSAVAENGDIKYNIEEYISIALENSLDLDLMLKEIDTLQEEYDDAVDLADRTPDTYGSTSVLGYKYTKFITPLEKLAELNKANNSYKDKITEITTDVKKIAMKIILLNKKLAYENNILDNIKEKYNIALTKYEKETITKSTLDGYDFDVKNQELKIKKLENELKTEDMNLKSLAGFELGGELLNVEDELVIYLLPETDINDKVIDRLESNAQVLYYQEMLAAKDKKLEIAGDYYNTYDYEYKVVLIERDNTALSLKKEQYNIEVSIRNGYNNLLALMDSFEITKMDTLIIKEKHDINILKYNNGMISKEELLNSENALIKKRISELEEAYSLSVGVIDFLQ
jgi:hypothetical protein